MSSFDLTLLLGVADPATLVRIREGVVLLLALILSIAVHEFGHAIAADKLGDRTPRSQGRVTLNPLAHADPIGTLLFPLIGFFSFGMIFGWGKPVMINPGAFSRRFRVKTAHMMVAAAGPAMNVVLAIVVTILFTIALAAGLDPSTELAGGIVQIIYLNWLLMMFNLIPCPPLDGGAVLAGILPDDKQHIIDFLNQWGFAILLGLLLIPGPLRILLKPASWLTMLSLSFAQQFGA